MLPVTVARSCSDNSAVRCLLPVLWMASFLRIMGHVAHGTGSNDVEAMLEQMVKICNIFTRGRHTV